MTRAMHASRPPPIPLPLGLFAEPFYRFAVASRNRAFDAGRRVARLPVPVISVGNISVGGTGKTPLVMTIVAWLRDAGRRPVVAMRGYGARPGAPSDEAAEHRARFPDLSIVAQPDRLAGLRPILSRGEADCVVLDDGFQHRFIARDLDLVLIDATRSPFADRCLPAGWLREPIDSLRRADAVVITHAEAVKEDAITVLQSRIRNLRSEISSFTTQMSDRPLRESDSSRPSHAERDRRCFISRHSWTGLRLHDPSSSPIERDESLDWLAGRPVFAVCGIGNPAPFIAGLEAAGARLVGVLERRDHHEWTDADARLIRDRAAAAAAIALATTEKDWVKLARRNPPGPPIARPQLTINLGADEALLKELVAAVIAR